MEDFAIKVENVSKEFKLPHEKQSSIKSIFINSFRSKKGYELQKALNNVSFEVKKGEFFGIVGRNGSGKSTLLKLLAGIYIPTSGQVHIRGSLTPFIELGVGFSPELTGRENVYLNGSLLGFNRKEMRNMYKDIVEFAELEKFMDQKLKNYSSGMQVRLAFSIAIRSKSNILLIDEVLAVGDANFQKKCMDTFEDLKRQGKTIVFVTHSMEQVRQFCDRVAVVDKGNLLFEGETEKAIDVYNKLNFDREKIQAEVENKKKEAENKRLGNGKALITRHMILDHNRKKTVGLQTGKEFSAEMTIEVKENINNCAIGVMFRSDPKVNLYGINSYFHGHRLPKLDKGARLNVIFKDIMPLNPGSYYVSFAIAGMQGAGYHDLDNLNNIMRVKVTGGRDSWGLIHSSPKISIIEKEA